MKTRYICHILQLNEAVTCGCCNVDADVPNAFNACIGIAKTDDLVLCRLVLSEARLVVTDVCICAVVETKVAIVLITSCGAQCIPILRSIICMVAWPEVR
jgi:hypothetical protein